jgi:hypothetical protein
VTFDALRQRDHFVVDSPPRNDEAADVVKVFSLADEDYGRPEFFEAAVGVEIALES